MQKGNIGVTTDNIFPIIKKFLYSDHEIFVRELVSNAVDASQKLKTFASVGEFKGELGELKVTVSIDKEKGTLTFSDRGIGMTAEEIEKYINQIAFSGAEEFLDKYKNDAAAIIGHFGLGFYSSFMVSKKVEIVTLSHKEGSQAVKWSCDGNPEYTLEETTRADRGTDIILYIDDENQEFLEQSRIEGLLTKYCKFLPVEVVFGKEQEWKDGKYVDTDKDKVINETNPAWTKKPADLKEEDYKKFYSSLYPMSDEPLFWIHLNVDYPFKLTGILYFPKLKANIEPTRNKIQLYSNQVFVTDSVEGIVPDFLTLMHGVIDSPDIPLNVSRSYLQSDGNVKKISSHITKKVADRLQEIFKEDRKQFEEKWESLNIIIEYGMLTDEKFYERAEKFVLVKNTDNQYFTLEEYKKLIEASQTDKDEQLVYLYATDREQQYTFIDAAKAKGYDVLLMDGQLDVHFLGKLEQKSEKCRFVRVDSDVAEKLIPKEEHKKVTLSENQITELQQVFSSQLPKDDKKNFIVTFEALGENAQPVMITQSEYMRRMKEMSALQPGMNFYGELPDSFNLVLNAEHALVKRLLDEQKAAVGAKIAPIATNIAVCKATRDGLKTAHASLKPEEVPTAEKEAIEAENKRIAELEGERNAILAEYAGSNNLVRQLIDIALLSNGMLKGEQLSKFIKRSVELL